MTMFPCLLKTLRDPQSWCIHMIYSYDSQNKSFESFKNLIYWRFYGWFLTEINNERRTRAFQILPLILIFRYSLFKICVYNNHLNNLKFKLSSLILKGPPQIPFKIRTKTMRVRNVYGTNFWERNVMH